MGKPVKLGQAIQDLIKDQGWDGNISDAECTQNPNE